jgi:uncharacterized protein YeaO (DUF488 family)
MNIQVKRIYDPPAPADGHRVLVDRLWPRGITRARAALDLWLQDIAPSPELRQWYGHDPARWGEFQVRYRKELEERPEAVATLRELARRGPLTLLFAARDVERNSAVLVKRFLEDLHRRHEASFSRTVRHAPPRAARPTPSRG